MAHLKTRSLCATAAIAAALALGSTSGMAQEAAPVVTPPAGTAPVTTAPEAVAPVTTTAPTTPVIVLPDVSDVPASEPAPAASQAATTAAPAAAAERATSTTRRAATASTRSAPAPRAVASEPSTPVASEPAQSATASAPVLAEGSSLPPVGPVSEQAAGDPLAAPAPAAADAAPVQDDGNTGAILAGVLALLGIGAGGYALARSRRRRAAYEDASYEDETYDLAEAPAVAYEPEMETPAAPVAPAVAATAAPLAAPIARRADPVARERRPLVSDTPLPAGRVTSTLGSSAQVAASAPVAKAPVIERAAAPERQPLSATPHSARDAIVGDGPIPRGEERDALLARMVDAAPDAENPFTSRKARRRRARMILQHRETLQRGAEPFDWRTYRPETKPSTPVSPTLVEA